MARINIEDKLHADKAFKRLVRNMGDEDRAVGLLYRFWKEAQDYWGHECALMPKDEFVADGFMPILEAGGLVEERPDGIFAIGSEKRFAWYLQKVRASKKALKSKFGVPELNPGEPAVNKNDVPVDPPAPSPVPALVPAPTKNKEYKSDPQAVDSCKQAWIDTLTFFGVPRSLMATEELEIGRAIAKYGATNVELALAGARFEPKTEGFDPKKYISIGRILTRDKDGKERIDRFISYGIEARTKTEAKAKLARQQTTLCEDLAPVSPEEVEAAKEKVKRLMGGMFGKMPISEAG